MEKSNITCASNIYPCKEIPYADQHFVDQLNDYRFIRNVIKKIQTKQSSVILKRKQGLIYKIETSRCHYAPYDPCRGYVDGVGIKCKCINRECSEIYKCNPDFQPQDFLEWTMDEEERELYGDPERLRKYYLVDLVSDEERFMYESAPEESGISYPPLYEEEQEEEKPSNRPYGRRKQIIGYENTYFGDADNQLSPIWGYVDYEEGGSVVKSKFGRSTSCVYEHVEHEKNLDLKIQKEKGKEAEKDSKSCGVSVKEAKQKKLLESTVIDRITDIYPVMELVAHLEKIPYKNEQMDIILANRAEMAYMSYILTESEIEHDIEKNSDVKIHLWNARDSFHEGMGKNIVVSTNLKTQGWTADTSKCWELLGKTESIQETIISGREFFDFSTESCIVRWGCRNLYGATHIVMEPEDFAINRSIKAEESVKLVLENGSYIVKTELTGEIIGNASNYFSEALEKLKKENEITDYPVNITGVVISGNQESMEIKGIGHMKFDEY